MKSKYGNKKTVVDGIKFDSLLESKYYKQLVWLKANDQIKGFDLQPEFVLQDKFKDKNGKTIRAIKYKADFLVYWHDGSFEIIDVKGSKKMLKADFKIKWKIVKCQNPDMMFRCISYNSAEKWHELDI